MQIKKTMAAAEFLSGETISDIRITIAARAAWDRYARTARIETAQSAPFTASLFWVWWELKRTGKIDFDFEEAMSGKIVDVELSEDEEEQSFPLAVSPDSL